MFEKYLRERWEKLEPEPYMTFEWWLASHEIKEILDYGNKAMEELEERRKTWEQAAVILSK